MDFRSFLFRVYRILFARKAFRRLNIYLQGFSLRGLGILNYENVRASGEESFLRTHLMGRHFDVVLDVGAHTGTYGLRVLSLCPDARVMCFEPHPRTYRLLTEAVEGTTIRPFNIACGADNRSITLFDYSTGGGSEHASVYRKVITGIHHGTPVGYKVKQVALDSFLARHRVPVVDLLKIDTEGNELEVLKGCRKYLRAGKIRTIQFEFNSMHVVSKVHFRDFYHLLEGYEFFRMLPGSLLPLGAYDPVLCEIYAFQNIVAIRKETETNFGRG